MHLCIVNLVTVNSQLDDFIKIFHFFVPQFNSHGFLAIYQAASAPAPEFIAREWVKNGANLFEFD